MIGWDDIVGMEFYLPQIAHLLVHLAVQWENGLLERFAFLVAQQSIHLALQLSFLLVGFMEDYQQEAEDGTKNPTADIRLYTRCATLLDKLEQAVVFGSPMSNKLGEVYRSGNITHDELLELEVADRKFQAMRIAGESREQETFELDGFLEYKRWAERGMFHQDRWIRRRFLIKERVLYCLRASDKVVKRSIPLQDCDVKIPKSNSYGKKFYFELKEKDRDRTYLLSADSKEQMDEWVAALRRAIHSPPGPASSKAAAFPLGETVDLQNASLSPAQMARYGFYRSEREFVRNLTDICEELRFVDRPARMENLRKKMAELQVPGCVYIPLCHSTDKWERLSTPVPDQCFAFSTKERCPCLMTFHVVTENENDDDELSDVASYLQQTLGFDGLADMDDEEVGQLHDKSMQNRSEFVRSARNSVTKMDLTGIENLVDEDNSSNNGSSRSLRAGTNLEAAVGMWRSEHTSTASQDVTNGANGKGNESNPKHDARSSLLSADLRLQAVRLFQKGSSGAAAIGNANGTGITKIDAAGKGMFLPALGKYMSVKDQEAEKPQADTSQVSDSAAEQFGKLIAKSNDDLRQEVFIMQLIHFLRDIWLDKGLNLYVNPYHIMSTAQTCGLIQLLQNADSFDGIKKKNDLCTMGAYLEKTFASGQDLERARRNFAESMAGYSLVCYILGIKDRHNGNIMINKGTGRVTHIDFGFVLGMAPGKDKIKHTNFSMERAAFKMTPELVDAMGGKNSDNYVYFNQLLVDGLLEARKHADTMLTLIDIMGYKSKLPCFNQPGGGTARVVRELKSRLMLSLDDKKAEKKMRLLAKKAENNRGTIFYEWFQKKTNGLAPCN